MRPNRYLFAFLILIISVTSFSQTSDFTYQGRLVAAGSSANTPHDFEFRLCAAMDACTPPLDVKQRLAVELSNGAFTVRLDFDPAHFNGADRWLEISVRPVGGTTFATLSPRQRVTSAPYSIKSFSTDTATNAAQLGGVAASQYVVTTDSRMTDARPPSPGSSDYVQNRDPLDGPQATTNFNISGSGVFGGQILFPNGTAGGSPLTSGIGTEGAIQLLNVGINSGREGAFNPDSMGLWQRVDVRPGSQGFFFYRKTGTFQESQLMSLTPDATLSIGTTGSGGIPGNLIVYGNSLQNTVTVSNGLTVNVLGTGGFLSICRNGAALISTCSSSLRYKINVRPFESDSGLIKRLRPVTFNWRADGTADFGLVAEEVADVHPLLVTYDQKGSVEGVKYDRIGVLLINVVKEQQARIDAQQIQINALKDLVCELRAEASVCKEK